MEIITYGNVQLLAGIMQGIAAIFLGADYGGMLVVVAAIGFMVALVSYAFQPQKLTGWYWMATVLMVSAGLVIPKTTVQIYDRLQNCGSATCVTTVPQVPFALAVLASVTSRIGDSLAEAFETTFGPIQINVPEGTLDPLTSFPDLNYRANGLMFGSKIVKETARVSFPDVNFRYNLTKYIDNCAGPDMADGTVPPNDVHISTDIWATLGGGNPARFTPTAGGVVMSCAALRNLLDDGMASEINAAMGVLGQRLNADALGDETGQALSSAGAQARVGSQVSQAYMRARLGGAGGDAAALIRQNAMINAMGDASALRAQRTNDPTAMMVGMAEAQAKISTNTSWITGAKVAEEAMPLIRNGIEAILYAAFPVVVLMLLVVSGRTAVKMITSYASTLLWIQLWPVLFAVLNYMATAAAARHLAAAGAIPSGTAGSQSGLSLLTAASIYENSISDVAVVGYLVISIPVIAWSLVKGMEAIGAGALAGAGAFTGGSATGATQAATGNITSGVTRMDDVRLAPHYGNANYSTHESADWNTTTRMGESQPRWATAKQSDLGGVSSNFVKHEADALAQKADASFGLAKSEDTKMKETLSSTFSEANTLAQGEARTAMETHASTSANGGRSSNGSGSAVTKTSGSGKEEASGEDASKTKQHMTRDVKEPFVEGLLRGGLGGGGDKYNDAIVKNDKVGDAYAARRKVTDAMGRAETAHDAQEVWSAFTKTDDYKNSHETFKTSDERIESGLRSAMEHETGKSAALQEGQRLSAQADWTRSNASNLQVELDSVVVKQMSDEERSQYAELSRSNPNAAAQMVENKARAYMSELYEGVGGGVGTGGGTPPGTSALTRLQPSIDEEGKAELRKDYDAAAAEMDPAQVRARHADNDAKVAAERTAEGLNPDAGAAADAGGKGRGAVDNGIGELAKTVAGNRTVLETDAALDRHEAEKKVAADKAGATPVIPDAQEGTQLRRDLHDAAREHVPLVKTVEDKVGDVIDDIKDWADDKSKPKPP